MKNRLLILSFIISFCFPQLILSQINPYSNVVNYSNQLGVQAYASCLNYDGSIMLAGYSSDGYGLLLNIDKNGDLQWNQTWKTAETNWYPEFTDIISTHDSCYFILGHFRNPNNDLQEAFYFKITNTGDTLWTAANTMGGLVRAYQTNDHGFILIGNHEVSGSEHEQIAIAKIDALGTLEWGKIMKIGSFRSIGNSIKQKENGNYLVLGGFRFNQFESEKSVMAELSNNGEVIWTQIYEDINEDWDLEGIDFVLINDHPYILFNTENNSVIAKTDTNGNIVWSKSIEDTQYWDFFSFGKRKLRKTPDNDLLFISTGSFSNYTKLDTIGNVLLHGYMEINASDIHSTEEDGILVCGNGPVWGVKYGKENIGLIQMDEEGYGPRCTETSSSYSTNKDISYGTSIFPLSDIGSQSNAHMELGELSLYQEDDKCVDFVGGTSEEDNQPPIIIYPNPSNGIFTIMSEKITVGEVNILNQIGQTVYEVEIQNGVSQIDIVNQSSGVYYYIVRDENGHFFTGMIVKN